MRLRPVVAAAALALVAGAASAQSIEPVYVSATKNLNDFDLFANGGFDALPGP